MRELIELGYNVIVVNDAVGAPGEEAYQAALTNYGYIANQVLTTEEVIAQLYIKTKSGNPSDYLIFYVG